MGGAQVAMAESGRFLRWRAQLSGDLAAGAIVVTALWLVRLNIWIYFAAPFVLAMLFQKPFPRFARVSYGIALMLMTVLTLLIIAPLTAAALVNFMQDYEPQMLVKFLFAVLAIGMVAWADVEFVRDERDRRRS
jgi:hypothetical protein